MIQVNIFKKKKTSQEAENKGTDVKQQLLNCLNDKLQGTLYDECVIMPKGFTVDVQIGKCEVKNDVHLVQAIYIIKNDDFDEPIIDPVDSQGKTLEDAVKMSVEIFFGGIWHPLSQSMTKKNPLHVSVNYLMQHYDFDMYAQSVVRIGGKQKQPTMLLNYIKSEIPKYLGSKKYYWLRIYLAKLGDRQIIEVRINGTVCVELGKFFTKYIETWNDEEGFACEKQYAVFVNREEDKCPFNKALVVDSARKAIELMENCSSPEEYKEIIKTMDEMTGIPTLAAEIRIFVPEILAKLTLGYKEGDSLFLMDEGSSIEFKKTQLRSYYYIQQVVLEYLQKQPEKEKVTRIVANSVAFRELRKVHEAGHEPKDLYVPGTSYRIVSDNYKVW